MYLIVNEFEKNGNSSCYKCILFEIETFAKFKTIAILTYSFSF